MNNSEQNQSNGADSANAVATRAKWSVPEVETIEMQRLVAALASCVETTPSGAAGPGEDCTNLCG